MYASLAEAKSRLSKLARALLLDHVGMMAPLLLEEVFAHVDAAKPQSEQQLLAEFVFSLRKVLPAELDSEQLIRSLCTRFEQD